MKIIINVCYGGFSVDEDVAEKLGYEDEWDDDLRTDARLIEMIENGEDCDGFCAKLRVVETPENTTDYMIQEYDGYESLIYVVDGKLHRA